MNHQTRFWGTLLLAGMIFSGSAAAQENSPPKSPAAYEKAPGDKAALRQKINQELGVSPEQITKMDAIRAEFENRKKNTREKLQAKETELKTVLDSEKPDRSKANTLADEINALQGAMMRSRIDHIFKIREILTPEQYRKLEEFRKKHHTERNNWKKPRRRSAGSPE